MDHKLDISKKLEQGEENREKVNYYDYNCEVSVLCPESLISIDRQNCKQAVVL